MWKSWRLAAAAFIIATFFSMAFGCSEDSSDSSCAMPQIRLLGEVVNVTGSRDRNAIQRISMQNWAAMRYTYLRFFPDKPYLVRAMTVKYAISEFGEVVSAQVVTSAMNNEDFENKIIERVRSWDFGKIDKPGDVTTVTYTFTFDWILGAH